MAIATETVIFDVYDAKVYPLMTDIVGASPTYGSAVDVPGIAQVSMDPNIISAELKGDMRVLAKRGRIDRFNMNMTYGKLAMDVLEIVIGGTVTSSGTTPNEVQTLRFAGSLSLPSFKVAFQITDTDEGIGDLTVVAYKCQVTGGTLLNGQTDQFGQPTMQVEAIAIQGSLNGTANVVADFMLHESETAIA